MQWQVYSAENMLVLDGEREKALRLQTTQTEIQDTGLPFSFTAFVLIAISQNEINDTYTFLLLHSFSAPHEEILKFSTDHHQNTCVSSNNLNQCPNL